MRARLVGGGDEVAGSGGRWGWPMARGGGWSRRREIEREAHLSVGQREECKGKK